MSLQLFCHFPNPFFCCGTGPSLANLHGGAEPPKFPKITPFRKGPPLPPYKNFPHGGAMAPLAPPSATGLA